MIERSGRALAILMVLVLSACDRSAGEDQALLADGTIDSFEPGDGRWMLVNYWAEWCAPCRREIPELNRLHDERESIGVAVFGVNYDGLRGDSLGDLVEEMDIQFPVLVEDPRALWDVEQPEVLPSTLVIDPEGGLKEVLVGPQTYESLIRLMEIRTST